MYLFRARDRRLMEQSARDIALSLQRDYRTFNPAKTAELSTRVPIYDGYLSSSVNAYPNVLWIAGSEADVAFTLLEVLLTQLGNGTYQTPQAPGGTNPAIWPPKSVTWQWIRSLYAFVNPAYASWLTGNNVVVPNWSLAP